MLGSLLISLGLDSGQFRSGLTDAEKQMKAAQKNFERIGTNFAKVGAALTVGITAPFTALIAKSIPAAQESAEAMGQVNAALASMGTASGRSAEQLQESASALMHLSTFDDDEILRKVTANLLTFGTVAGEQFDRAQRAAVDLSTRMGGDLQASTILVGKALNDPIKGMGALRKVGIQLTEQQKDQVKAFVAAGNAAGAQRVILGELEHQFGGSAKAMRAATPGADLKNSWDDFQETIGGLALRILPPLTSGLSRVIELFNTLSPTTQAVVVGAVAIAAALGPVLVALGGLISVSATLIPALVAMGASVGVVAAEVGVATAVSAGLGVAIGTALPFLAAFAGAATLAYAAFQHWGEIKSYIDGIAERMKATQGDIDSWFKGINDWAAATDKRLGIPSQKQFTDSAGAQISALWTKINSYDLAAWARGVDVSIAAAFTRAINWARNLYTGVKLWLSDKLGAVFAALGEKVKAAGDFFYNMWDRVVGHSYVPDMVDEIGAQMARLQGNMVDPIGRATGAAAEAFRKLQQDVAPILDRLFPDQARMNTFRSELGKLQAYAKAKNWSPDQTSEAVDRLYAERRGDTPGDIRTPLSITPVNDQIAIDPDAIAKAAADTTSAIQDQWGKVKDQNVALGESFAQTTRNVTSSLQGLMGSIKSGDWLGALSGIVDAFTQLAGSGLFGGKMQTKVSSFRGFGGGKAVGGPVMGNTDYIVGEEGPEILRMGGKGGSIVPNHQIGGKSVVEVRVTANDYFDARVQDVTSPNIASMGQRAAGGGASLAQTQIARRQRQRLGR